MMLCMQCLFSSHLFHSHFYTQALVPVCHSLLCKMSDDRSPPSSVCQVPSPSPSSFQVVPSPAPSVAPGAQGAQGQVEVALSRYRDVQTKQPITTARVAEIISAIHKLQADLQKGKEIYDETIAHGGSKAEAQAASNRAAGGKFTRLYDNLCRQKVLISMQAKLPPASNQRVMYGNEDKLATLIYQCSPFMSNNKVGTWTSRHEIGQACETTCYVRWPYFLGEDVEALAEQMTHMKVDCHSLQCQLVFEGRTKLWQHDDTPEQWEVTIGGHTHSHSSQMKLTRT